LEDIIGDCPQLTDKASGLFNAAYATGCIAAPLIGAALNEKWGFPTTCDVLALSAILSSILYFTLSILP
jgi:predicted MFS family arabinose efflux permease